MKTETSYPFVVEWFKRAAGDAKAQGRKDSAQLWRDGLEHLEAMREQREALLDALEAAVRDAASPGQWLDEAKAAIDKATS